uniref:G-protein coupled receptors family 1 profile domain-containing protein n=1 Tax=Capitella teleta TaxID=283909 RepID=X2B6Y5_CAPTE
MISSMEQNTSNSTMNSSVTPSVARDEQLARVEVAVQATIFAMAVVGNLFVLIAILNRRRIKCHRMQVLIAHLSLADLFVAFFNVLPQLIWDITFQFYGTDILCKFVKFGQVVGMYSSSYVLVTTALDRYLAICHPLTSHTITDRRVHYTVLGAWLLSVLFSLPQFFIFALKPDQNGAINCWATFEPQWTLQLYVTWTSVAIFVIPSILLVFIYGRICHCVWRTSKNHDAHTTNVALTEMVKTGINYQKVHFRTILSTSTPSTNGVRTATPRCHTTTGMSSSKIKTAKLTATVILCYMFCWSPFFVSQMWAAWDDDAPFEGKAMVIIMLLASLNSCTNPWIYLAYGD